MPALGEGAGDHLLRSAAHAVIRSHAHTHAHAHARSMGGGSAAGATAAFSGIGQAIAGAIGGAMHQVIVLIAAFALGIGLAVGVIWYIIYKSGAGGMMLRATGATKALDAMPPSMRSTVGGVTGLNDAAAEPPPEEKKKGWLPAMPSFGRKK